MLMLRDSKAIETLAKENQSLFEKIRDWLQKFAEDVRKAFQGKEARHAEAKAMLDYVDELVELWDKGLLEARESGEIIPKANLKNTSAKMSVRTFNGVKVAWIEHDITKTKPKNVPIENHVKQYIENMISANGAYIGVLPDSGMSIYAETKNRTPSSKYGLAEEYVRSTYTKWAKNKHKNLFKAKMKAAGVLGDLVSIANSRTWEKTKHQQNKDAKYGVYIYNSIFAFPVYDADGNTVNVRAYDCQLVILNASDGRKYLYDVKKIKENTAKANDILLSERQRAANVAARQGDVLETTLSQPTPVVKKSLREDQPFSQKFSRRDDFIELGPEQWQEAKTFFGTTSNYEVAGYALPDGKMLDFSGKHWGDTSSTFRQVDHRDVWDVWERNEYDGNDELVNMLANGAVRLSPENGGINLSVAPAPQLKKTLRGFINHFDGEIVLDLDDLNGATLESVEYPIGTSSSRILADIDRYFSDGTVPSPVSAVAQFRYSRRDSSIYLSPEQARAQAASYTRLKAENRYLRDKLNFWKGQTKVTELKTVRDKDVRSLARRLVNEYSSAMDITEVRQQLRELGNRLVQDRENIDYTELGQQCWLLSQDMIENAEAYVETGYEGVAADIKQDIKGYRLLLDKSLMADLPEGFRKQYSGKGWAALTESRGVSEQGRRHDGFCAHMTAQQLKELSRVLKVLTRSISQLNRFMSESAGLGAAESAKSSISAMDNMRSANLTQKYRGDLCMKDII